MEFSGACSGCGETPQAKLVTQLQGDRMIIANATGCTSIWGGNPALIPQTKNKETGKGPAWASSLFEDNAEFGLGLHQGLKKRRVNMKINVENALEKSPISQELRTMFTEWVEVWNDLDGSNVVTDKLITLLDKTPHNDDTHLRLIKADKNLLGKTSTWIFGGDGWAQDIGFGGLDHVISTGEDVNILVFDTEMYSNTGGQMSKSTPKASFAKFGMGGKDINKKNLGLQMMQYGDVQVASIAIGADYNQTLKAFKEAAE